MELFLKIVTVILLSSFKFIVGISTAILYDFNQLEILVLCVGGGMFGVIVSLYAWENILKLYHRYFPRKPKPVKFSKWKRRLVHFIKKYEVWGIALLSPILLSIPLGTILSAAIEHDKWRIKFIMFCSLCFWTLA